MSEPQSDRDKLKEEFIDFASRFDLDVDVFSEGPLNAEVLLVGEGPGQTEVEQGRPWIGGAGKLLFDGLRKYGLHRANVYATNVVKRQISLQRKGNERHAVLQDELDKWIGMLKWEISRLPNVRFVLVMGNYALEALVGESKITNWRGSVLDGLIPGFSPDDNDIPDRKVKFCITVNPAFAQREPKLEPTFLQDLYKLDMLVRNSFRSYEINHIINPTAPEALKYIRGLQRQDKPVSLDIEGINNETACFGIGNTADEAMCISLRDLHRNRYTLTEEADIMLALQSLCDSHRIIAQNGSFDAYFSWLHSRLAIRIWHDTLLAHHTLYPQLPHSLAFLVAQYTTHPFYKDEGKNWREGGDIDQFWRYNCKDVALTLACHLRLERELEQQGLSKFFYSHVMRAHPHLVEATVHGVRTDPTVRERLREQVGGDVNKALIEFYRLVHELTEDEDYNPNPGSWQQLQGLFFDRLGLVGHGKSTDETNREHMMKHPATSPLAKEMLGALGRWKEEDKFLSTYVEAREGPDGRMRTNYKQNGTTNAPGRLSSTGLLDGQGCNLQNQPPRAREMFIADPGCVFVYFDLKQAEAVVVAYRANIPKWKEQFERARIDGKYDCHRALASEMFKIDYNLVPVYDFDPVTGLYTIRYVSKRCRHGLNYRMQIHRLAEVTGLPYHEAARAFRLYHHTTPELRKWWEAQEKDFKQTKTIFNALGRRFKVIQRIDDRVLESIVAFYPQSTIGDKITEAWYQSEEDDEWPSLEHARVCLDVHDNLVALTTPKYAKTVAKILKKHAESPMFIQDVYKHKPEQVIIPADLKISTLERWEKKKDGSKVRLPDDTEMRWSNMKELIL